MAITGTISSIVSAPDGRLFAGIAASGLRVYSPNAQGVYGWSSITATAGGLPSNRVNDLAVFQGELWVATADAGCGVLSLASGTWRAVNTGNSGSPSNTVNRITVVPPAPDNPDPQPTDWQLWLATSQGAARYSYVRIPQFPGVWRWYVMTTAQGLPDPRVRDIAVQFVGGVRYTWFATETQLCRWDGSSVVNMAGMCNLITASRIVVDRWQGIWCDALRYVPGKAGDYVQEGLCHGRILLGLLSWQHWSGCYGRDMDVDAAGRLWTANNGVHNGGAWVHDRGRWCVFTSPDYPLYSNNVSAVHAAGELTWFGHGDAPRISTYTPNWTRHTAADMASSGTPGAVAYAGGILHVGLGGGVSWRDGDGPWNHAALGNSAAVTALLRTGATLYVATAGNGMFSVSMPSGSAAHWSTADGLPSNDIRALALDDADRLWAGTSAGLALRANGYWLVFTHENSPLASNDIRSLGVDAEGRVWIGTGGGGLSVLDPEAKDDVVWSYATAADGLPSNTVLGIARAAHGDMWVATDGGAARWSAETAAWTVYGSGSGALPGDAAFSIAIDQRERVWVGTNAGLALYDGAAWTHYHPSNALIGSDRVRHLACGGTDVAVSAGATVAVRRDLEAPLGAFPPQISSFSPAQAAPGALVTITGNHFDDRGPEFNVVTVGIREAGTVLPAPVAEILSVSRTSLLIRVPQRAEAGTIKLWAHCLPVESATRLEVAPRIEQVDPVCVGLGDLITVRGAGFAATGGCDVRVGSGPWRSPLAGGGSFSPDQLRVRVMPGDTSGTLRVRNQHNNLQAQSAKSVTMGSIQVKAWRVQQAVGATRLIWGKRTLVQIELDASGCGAHVTGGRLYWKRKSGGRQQASYAYIASPGGLSVRLNAPQLVDGVFHGIDFVAEWESNRSAQAPFFPASDFDGFEVELVNNGVTVLTASRSAAGIAFTDIGAPVRFVCMSVVPTAMHEIPPSHFQSYYEGWQHTARIWPLPDYRWLNYWLTEAYASIARDTVVIGQASGEKAREAVGDFIDPDRGTLAVAMVHESLYQEGTPPGVCQMQGIFSGTTAMVFNLADNNGRILAHEAGHSVGLVLQQLVNHDDGNRHHSRYDEGAVHGGGVPNLFCHDSQDLTFRQAMIDQTGHARRVYLLLADAPPRWMPSGFCDLGRPKSLMSYAPWRLNNNAFLEPSDHYQLVHWLQALADKKGLDDDKGGEPLALRLRGSREEDGRIEVTLSYVDDAAGGRTPAQEEGGWNLVFRGAANAVLKTFPFTILTESAEGPLGSATFALAVGFPEATRRVEISDAAGTVLWSRTVSARAPTVTFLTPAGGRYRADRPIAVTWSAADADGDALQFALDYSADGGATWRRLPQYLTGALYEWTPYYLPVSAAARLRIRASDGFNTATALSAPFEITPGPPHVFIVHPRDGDVFTEGSRVDLAAASFSSKDPDAVQYEWRVNGRPLGASTRAATYEFERVGSHTIEVAMSDGPLNPAGASVAITIVGDYDRDGIPNDWELAHGLNPMDKGDAALDFDGDGLSNYGEYLLGTDPWNPDSDGDGWSDGEEFAMGTSPGEAGSMPVNAPVLRVGTQALGLQAMPGAPSSNAQSFWVTNSGTGDVVWTAEAKAAWLRVQPAGGTAPTEVTVSASAAALAAGVYTATVEFNAPGAFNSPQAVTVTLEVVSSAPSAGGFTRGDSNMDGMIDIGDPIHTLGYLFGGAAQPPCLDAVDANDDGNTDIADAIHTLTFLFAGGAPPPPPYPGCGTDPTADALDCAVPRACP